MNRKIGNRITSFVLVLLMVCSTVSNTGLTAFAETSDGNSSIESVDFTDGSDTVTNPADETSATLVDSETAATLSAVRVLTYATDEENITDAYLGIALTGGTAFEEGSTLSCHMMDDQERASYVESLQSELNNDETKTRQVSMVKAFDLGVLASNHSVQKTFDASMTVRMYLQNADALSDTALYVRDENQAWHEVPFEVYESSDGTDETESKVAHGLPYIQCSTNQLGTFAFAKVSETDISIEPDDSAHESGIAQEPVYEAKTYVYEDDDVRITAETTAEAKIASDAVLCAKKLTGESYEKAWKQVSDAYPLEAGQELVYVPYDVYFTVDDTKVEPEAGLVKVSMTYKSKHMGVELDDGQTVAEVKAGHICEDGRVEILENSAKKESVVTFDVSSFSPMGGIMVVASNPVNNVYWWYDDSKTTLHLSNKAETNAYRLFTSGQPWSGYSGKITQVVLDTEIQPTCTASWFFGCKALTHLDFGDKLNTVDVTDMHQMFDFCENLNSLELGSKFDTSHVTNTNTMFGGCQSLESLDLGDKFDTSCITDMGRMFQSCIALKSLRLGDKFDTSSVTDMSYLFSSCSNLQQLDLGNQFGTGSAVSMEAMFNECSSLEELNLGSRFDTSNVTNMMQMFNGCSSLISLDLGDKFDTSHVQTMVGTFCGCTSLKSLRLGDRFDTSSVTDMANMFQSCSSLISLHLGDKFYTGNVTNMYAMFTNCSALLSLDLGDNFDTGKVTNFFGMFFGCSSMTSLDMGDKFDTSLASNVRWMFRNCDALQKLVSQKSGRQDIELPRKMIEQDSQNGVVYSVMPSGSKILVPFTLSVAESITSTTVVMRKSMDKSFENVPIFEFGVYREDGTLVDTVKNDKDGNIVIETKDYALGRYYVQEKAGTGANIIYDTSKYYFTVSEVQEKVTGVNVSHDSNQVTYYTPVKSSLLTGGNLQLSGYSGVTVTDSEGKTHTLKAYCANVSKHSPHGTAKQVYINPTDAEINEARGTVYAGPQENLSDAIRCILYFENENAQQRIWDLLNRGEVIDTSRVNEIPAEFQFAIITPPSFDMQPLIVPLADIRVVSTEDKDVMEEITTGIVKKRVVTLETPVSVFENRTSSKTYIIKQDEAGNVLYGAKLSLWKDGKLVRSFTTTVATFGAVLADGDYILREDEAPHGYEKAADISFQVKDHVVYQNGAAVSENTIVMTDKAVETCRLTIRKVDEQGKLIQGALLRITDASGKMDYKLVTTSKKAPIVLNLPAGEYTITEVDAPADYLIAEPITVKLEKDETVTMVDKDGTHVSVQKVWHDDDEVARPETITVGLYRNGEHVQDYEVTKANDWKLDIKHLEKADEQGNLYKYTVKETVPDGYLASYDVSDDLKDVVIANTTAVEFNGTKVWKDNDDANRPSSVSVRLLRNGTEIAATQATADNGWTYQFAAQPKYDKHGKAYLYSIKEAYERGYDVSYDHASAKGISLILQYQIESGDSCYVYYYKDGKLYKSEPYRGSAKMSEVVLDIPSTEFWVEFSSDYSGCSYYGMKVTSVKGLETVPGTFGKVVTGLPTKGYTKVDVDDATQIETLPHGNYGNNVKKLWHYKADGLLCDDVHITNTKLPEETTHIAIAKVDEQDEPLAGAQLQLLDKQGNVVKEWVSETSAERLDGIAAGTYRIHEVSAPEGYEIADDAEITISNTTDLQMYTFVNKRIIQKSTLTVSKKVAGSFGDKYKEFKFCLALDDDSITSLSYMKDDATETVTRNADNQFEFTLSHGESVVFADLPVGTGYTVTEPDAKAEGYEVTADGATGTIQENGSTVLFTNHRNMVVPTELDTNMAVFGMILAAGCILLIGYCLKRRKK